MKLTSVILSILILLLSFGLSTNKQAYANNHKVKSIIIIPGDWHGRIDQEKQNKFKVSILDAMRKVRTIYAKLLNGKTFDIDENIEVENNPVPSFIFNLQRGTTNYDLVRANLFGWNKGLIVIRWVIGLSHNPIYATGGSSNPDSGVVDMTHQALLHLLEDDNSDEKKFALTALAHETGHALDLVKSDFAEGHPCTIVSTDECKEKTPKPYPSEGEWGSIMGYGSPFWNFPDLYFNNSLVNPEIWKLYHSPFINPENDPAPEPQPTSVKQSLTKRLPLPELSPFIAGQRYIITWDKFGEPPGKIEFFRV